VILLFLKKALIPCIMGLRLIFIISYLRQCSYVHFYLFLRHFTVFQVIFDPIGKNIFRCYLAVVDANSSNSFSKRDVVARIQQKMDSTPDFMLSYYIFVILLIDFRFSHHFFPKKPK